MILCHNSMIGYFTFLEYRK